MLGPEQCTEQVKVPKIAAFRAPVALVERHAEMERTAQHPVSERSVCHQRDLVGRAAWEDLRLHAAIEHVPGVLHDIDATPPHRLFDLRQAEIRDTDVARFALPYD